MGNSLTSTARRLLTPRPSDQRIYAATLSAETALKASEIIHLIVIDRQTGERTNFYIKRTLPLANVRNFIAWRLDCSVEKLELRIDGKVVAPSVTVDELGLTNGMKLQFSRLKDEADVEQVPQWVDRHGPERVEDEARMRALFSERFDKKCRLARESLGLDDDPE